MMKKRCAMMLTAATLAFGLSGCVSRGQFKLASDGKPVAEIVADAPEGSPLNTAAQEFRHWVGAISGAKLDIVKAPSGNFPNAIAFSADQSILDKYPEDAKKLAGNDGYAARLDGNTLHIFGSRPKGAINGAFKILFKNTDIIWARPNKEFGTLFSQNPNLVLDDCDHIDVPAYIMRGWQFPHGVTQQEFEWCIRNSANWTNASNGSNQRNKQYGMWEEAYFGHNLTGLYIRGDKYGESNPEYFSERNGKRLLPGKAGMSQLCFSNQEMTKDFIKEFDIRVAARPEASMYGVFIEDNYQTCQCKNCMEDIKLPDGTSIDKDDPRFLSTRFFLFLNQVARHAKIKCPYKKIQVYGYFFTEIPPAIDVEDNVIVLLCPIYKNVKFPVTALQNEYTGKRLNAWLKAAKDIIMYEYFGLTNEFPRPADVAFAQDLIYQYENGINKIHTELMSDDTSRPDSQTWKSRGLESWKSNAIYFWVMNELKWNPYANVNKLRKEFLQRVYREAAPYVEKYLQLTEKAWRASSERSTWNTPSANSWASLADLGYYQEACALLDQAKAIVKDPKTKKMVEELADPLQNNTYLKDWMKQKELVDKFNANPSAYKDVAINGDFETTMEDQAGEDTAREWLGTKIKGWSFWWLEPQGKYGIALTEGVNNSKCLFMDNVKNSCFIQGYDTKPGRVWLVTCKVKKSDPEDKPHIFIRWVKPDGKWLDQWDRYFRDPVDKTKDGWYTIQAVVTVPEGAGCLRALLGCNGCNGRILFDDYHAYDITE